MTASSPQLPTILYGYIQHDGSILSGNKDKFTVSHDSVNGKGTYYINFNTGVFTDLPAITVTIECDDYTSGWWVGALVLNLGQNSCEILCLEGDNKTKIDTNFSFTAIAQPATSVASSE